MIDDLIREERDESEPTIKRPPVLVVGCGPSAVRVTRRQQCEGMFHVATVNDAISLVESAEFAAFNDTPALLRLTPGNLQKIHTIILPRYLHDDPAPRSFTLWTTALDRLAQKIGPWPSLDVQVYTLHTDPDGAEADFCDLPYPNFGRCRSTSDSLIAFLMHVEYRRIMTTGIEWDGSPGHHPDLPPGGHKSPDHRQQIWEHTLRRVDSTPGARVEQWNGS